jgi:hypothetical protein
MSQYISNLEGFKTKYLTVISFAGISNGKRRLWHCKCICGNEKTLSAYVILDNENASCGCIQQYSISTSLIGKKFQSLTVIAYCGSKNKNRRWLCRCDCGKEKIITTRDLKHHKSCGCAKVKAWALSVHGLSNSREYKIWTDIKTRCYNPKKHNYQNYGGRGIRMCDRWLNSFSNFIEDMGMRPSKSHSIDRINVDGNYEPSNCKWSTNTEQANNRRTSKFIEFQGVRLTCGQWDAVFKRCKGYTFRALKEYTFESIYSRNKDRI